LKGSEDYIYILVFLNHPNSLFAPSVIDFNIKYHDNIF
jgi:hypothetical protein